MKKILSFILIFAFVFALASCGRPQEKAKDEIEENEIGNFVPETDPIYQEIADMVEPITKFVEYNHISNNKIDYENVDGEDFWNMMAIIVSSYDKITDYAEIDTAGVYHVDWDVVLDFAKTFFYQSWYRNSTPSYKNSYSASADPGSGVIDLIPLSVDNFVGRVESIEKAESSDKPYDYILNVDLETSDDNPTVHHYHVFISDWNTFVSKTYGEEDHEEHIMPYVISGMQFVGTDEPKN